MALFSKALQQMADADASIFPPTSFQAYLRSIGIQSPATARHISIQGLSDLAPELRAQRTMVFRLGCPAGAKQTFFALAKCVTGWSDYFFIDEELFSALRPEVLGAVDKNPALRAFALLPKFTETSLVNLALASGQLKRSLGLDENTYGSVPATGQGTYSFEVTPHPAFGVTWQHVRGQVEIDAVFVARRSGIETVFVVEAKAGGTQGSLAKHKLAYAMLAMKTTVPKLIPVVGVYLRSYRRGAELHFRIAECTFAGVDHSIASMTARPLAHQIMLLGSAT